MRLLFRTRLAWFAVAIVVIMVVLAFTADFLTPYDPNTQRYQLLLQPPSLDFPMGTDDLGRDVYSRLVYGTRIRKTIRYAEAPVKGSSVLKYDPTGPAAEAYRDLAKEVLDGAQARDDA